MTKYITALMTTLIIAFAFASCGTETKVIPDGYEEVETESFHVVTEPVAETTESAYVMVINDEFVVDTDDVVNFKAMSDTEKEAVSVFVESCNGEYEVMKISKNIHDEDIIHFVMYYLDCEGYHVCVLAEGMSPRLSESKNIQDMSADEWFEEYFSQYKIN